MKKWTVSRADDDAVKKITSSTDLPRLLAEIMSARGYNDAERLAEFFNGAELSDPFLLADMRKAADALEQSVDSGELICVFGDYDCDGVISTAVLYGYLMSMGADVVCRIPERDEGYGLSEKAVREMAEQGVSLIVTVDNGITALKEAELINDLGMKLIITDHHQPADELPKALAVVDPHRSDCHSPFKQLCGAGVVLKLCAALDGGDYGTVCEQYLDLVAIATVADVVPLIGENRVIVSEGMRLLKNTENLGLLALMEQCGVDPASMNASSVSYTIAPRINASSRFGSPTTALNMLISEDESAGQYAAELSRLNALRKEAESAIFEEIVAEVDSDPALLCGRVLTVYGKGWHRGVIGIVASRLVEIYGKPAIVISVGEDGTACGSARSILGFNVFRCFDFCKDILIKYGGHELAGGLTVLAEKLPQLKEAVEKYAESACREMPCAEIRADKLLRGADITPENAASLGMIEPCGQQNPEPVFALSGAEILSVLPLKNGEHTKLELSYDGARVSALLFRQKTADFPLSAGEKIDLMANMTLNEYKGSRSAALRVMDYRPHGLKQEPFFAACSVYEKFRRGEKVPPELLKKGDPTREQLVSAYKAISGGCTFEGLFAKLRQSGINAFMLRIIIDAFCDTGLAEYFPSTGKIVPKQPASRVDISRSDTLKALRALI